MAIKKQVDLPVWEWARFAPVATAATSAMCAGEATAERYLYYLSTTFYRYDTWTDDWQQLSTPPTAAVTAVSLRYTNYGGYRGNILAATATTATIPGIEKDVFTGSTIRITSGTGAGQERTITAMSDKVVWDHGIMTLVTSTANAIQSFVDSTKKWKINQWIGYQVRVVYGTGQSLVRKVLYNDATTIYLYDPNYQQLEPWNNTPINPISAPYATPVLQSASAGSFYFIESSDITVATWDVTPDASSSFVIMTGGIWMMSAAAAGPFNTFQYYDVISDTWTVKTAIAGATPTASVGGHLVGAIGTDFNIERTGEIAGHYQTGTASAGAARTLTIGLGESDMTVDRWANYQLRITAGTGIGQRKRIVANNTRYFEVESPWATNPDNTSVYKVFGNTDTIYFAGNGQTSMYKYSVENDLWYGGEFIDVGQTINMSVKYPGQEAFAISSGAINTGGITAVNSSPTAGGTGYVVGDILTISTGGAGGKVRVTAVAAGVVTGVELYAAGTSAYTTGTGKATTGGTGSGCTVNITSVGNTGRVITVQNHNLIVGDSITIAGVSTANWNGTYSVLTTDAVNQFDIITTASGAAAATSSQSTTLLVDATKNWATNEHIGKVVEINTLGPAPSAQLRRITANTATTLTLQSALGTAAANGTSRYIIRQPEAFGRDEQYKVASRGNSGWATGGSGTTLVDNTKSWNNNQWANYKFRVIAGTGVGSEVTITSNDATTLTYSAPGFTADTTTKYLIMDTFGLATAALTATTLTDTTKNWTTNQWSGKRLRLISGSQFGTAAATALEVTIASNTATVLTFATVTAVLSTDVTYTILGAPARSTGIQLAWVYGNSVEATKGKYLIIPRGGASNVFDRYDITTGVTEYTMFMTPQTETMTTGTMYNYDGVDRIIFTPATTTNSRIFALNVNTLKVEGVGLPPYAHSTAILGNRMEIVTTSDGYDYLYVMRHSGQEMWRALLVNY